MNEQEIKDLKLVIKYLLENVEISMSPAEDLLFNQALKRLNLD